MKITMYGTRGSLPSPSRDEGREAVFDTRIYGGNTTCVLVEHNGTKYVLDAGTGIKVLGDKIAREKNKINILITHTHWDHIQGFPFFAPAYIKGNEINIYGDAKVTSDLVRAVENHSDIPGNIFQINGLGIRQVLESQQNPRNFPAPLAAMAGLAQFYDFIPGGTIYNENGLQIKTMKLNHPGECISYKFIEQFGDEKKTFVFSTDFEPDNDGLDEMIIEWWKGADLVIADAQYEKDSPINKFMKGWGHSDFATDIRLAKSAGIKRIYGTHHEPRLDDRDHLLLDRKMKEHGRQSGIESRLVSEGEVILL